MQNLTTRQIASVTHLNSQNDIEDKTLITDNKDKVQVKGLDEDIVLEQIKEENLEQILDDKEFLAAQSLFLNKSYFIKSGNKTEVKSKMSYEPENSSLTHQNLRIVGKNKFVLTKQSDNASDITQSIEDNYKKHSLIADVKPVVLEQSSNQNEPDHSKKPNNIQKNHSKEPSYPKQPDDIKNNNVEKSNQESDNQSSTNNDNYPAQSIVSTIQIKEIVDDSRVLDIANTKAMTNINNATKYFSFSQSDTAGSYGNFSGEILTISDKTPKITARIAAVKDLKVSLVDANLNEVVIDPSEIHVSSSGTFSYTPKNELSDGVYTFKIVGKSDDGAELSSNLKFAVDTTPIKFENIHIEKDVNTGENLINFNLLNFSGNDKFENIKAYIQNHDTSGDLMYSTPLELTQNGPLVSAKYNGKLNFGDELKIKATDAAGTTHTHINKILIPTFTQIKSDHDTSVNVGKSVENWETVELNDSGFRADGSRIIINDDKPYFRAIIPDTTGFGTEVIKHKDEAGYIKPAYIQVVAKNLDSAKEINLDFQVVEKPVNSTPDGYLRLTGYSDKLSADQTKSVKLEDGVYELSMKGGYQNGDVWLNNPIKFTVDSNAPKFENSSLVMNFDQTTNKTLITGKISDEGVSASYELIDHFKAGGAISQDSFEVYKNDGTKIESTQNLAIHSDGNFSVEYDLDVANDGFYTALKDIAGNTTVAGNDQDNFIVTKNGDDDIVAGGGRDVVNSGDGADTVHGGAGDDVIDGGSGDDTLRGNEGDDEIYGNDGRDEIHGDEGSDKIYGGKGADRIYGDAGDDTIYGEDGDDEIDGNDGDDTIYGGEGGDLIRGGSGNDTIIAGAGNDRIYGGDGDNVIDAEEGNDMVYLDISTLGGADKLPIADANGGSGIDTLVLNPIGGDLVDFSKINQAEFAKIKNFEGIDLGGDVRGVELKGLDVKDVLDINGGRDVVLKFEGDSKDKIYLKDNFAKLVDQTDVQSGYVRYGNNATADAIVNSVKIDVDKDIVTDFI